MDRMPLGVVGSFHQGFAQRRVGMHIAGDLGRRELHHLRHGQLGQQLTIQNPAVPAIIACRNCGIINLDFSLFGNGKGQQHT